jgi:hypothetical protein
MAWARALFRCPPTCPGVEKFARGIVNQGITPLTYSKTLPSPTLFLRHAM